jgi:hypothetical protein
MQQLRSETLTLEEIVEAWLPARVGALDNMLWVLELSDRFGSDAAIQLHIKDGPAFSSSLRLFSEPMLAAGYIHARALLEFMGISAKDGALIQVQRRRSSDVAIEHYSVEGNKLDKVTLDEVFSAIDMPRVVVEWALVTTIEIATSILERNCQNCDGELVARPTRPFVKHANSPASTKRIFNPAGCERCFSLIQPLGSNRQQPPEAV